VVAGDRARDRAGDIVGGAEACRDIFSVDWSAARGLTVDFADKVREVLCCFGPVSLSLTSTLPAAAVLVPSEKLSTPASLPVVYFC